MAIQAKALGLAAGIVVGAAFALCALAVAIAPAATTQFFSWVLHIDLTAMTRRVTVLNVVGGVALLSLYVGLIVGLTGKLYNRLAARVG